MERILKTGHGRAPNSTATPSVLGAPDALKNSRRGRRQRANLPAGLGGSRPADKTARKPAAHQRARRRTLPARECVPSGGRTLKRNETCAGKDGVAAEEKRR